ncbi:TatD family hydrolase [Vibrio astriarenae]|uniref:TatD family hydrolase n=1 Tax=Vibrio astriarenae TaxID=1481923 RepID=UPI003736022A
MTTEIALFDSHCHFDFDVFAGDFDAHLTQARQAGVKRMLIPAIGKSNWSRLENLSRRYNEIDWALGCHPYFLSQSSIEQVDHIVTHFHTTHTKPIAIGECGLDKMVEVDFALQRQVLQSHLTAANELQLPVVLHSRKAHNDLLHILKQQPAQFGGILHGFSGSFQQAMQFVEKGLLIGVGGVITYPRANKTRNAIRELPLECIALETDAPDMPINHFQGQPNHPKRLPVILSTLSELKQTEKQTIAQKVWQNTTSLF